MAKLYYFNQKNYEDEKKYPYNKPNGTKASIGSGGCGVVAATIVFDTMAQKELYTPVTMAAFSIKNKARTNDGTNETTLLNALVKANKGFSWKGTSDVNALVNHLKSGGMAICNQGKAYNVFSTAGHYVVAYKMDGSNIEVVDPQMTPTKYDKFNRPQRIVKKTATGCVVKPSEMKKATKDRSPSYYLVSYKKPTTTTTTTTSAVNVKGIDVSHHKKGFKLVDAQKKGYEFAILKGAGTGYRDSRPMVVDETFEDFYKQAKAIGMPVGVFYYSCANDRAFGVAEAKFFYEKCLKGKQFEYPVFIDVEDNKWQLGHKKGVTDAILGFCEYLEAKGYYVSVYACLDWFNNKIDTARLSRIDKWVAAYRSTKPNFKYSDFTMWQNSENTKIGKYEIDTDFAYLDFPKIIKSKGLNGFKK